MKIFFRYLFVRLLQPFVICLAACSLIWIMADLYGNLDDFFQNKVSVWQVVRFYSYQIPKMLVFVLPATLLFSSLFTLLNLNRRCELVALQSGGMAPLRLFSPFLLFAFILSLVLALDMSSMAATAEAARERILKQIKGDSANPNVYLNLPYVDGITHRVWFLQKLNTKTGVADGVELLLRDTENNDTAKYLSRKGQWNGEYWQLTNVLELTYNADGTVSDQKLYPAIDLTDITTPPNQLSFISSEPEQLTLWQLYSYLDGSSGQTEDRLAKFRTEWWYRLFYPSSLIVLLLFALVQGTVTDRRGAVAGVFNSIFVFLAFLIANNIFMAAGRQNRLPAPLAASASELIFASIGLYLLAQRNGWFWSLHRWWIAYSSQRSNTHHQ